MADLSQSHPVLANRVRMLLQHPTMARYGIKSTRTKEQQQKLYDKYKRGRGNLAADPNRSYITDDGWEFHGSWHMIQADGLAHAVDLARPLLVTRKKADATLKPLLEQFGLKQTVSGEWWHVQARDRTGWFPGPDPATEDDEGEEDDMITLIDTDSGEHWVAANGKARPLADPARWMSGWKGPVRESPTMKHVIEDLYELTSPRADSSAVEAGD